MVGHVLYLVELHTENSLLAWFLSSWVMICFYYGAQCLLASVVLLKPVCIRYIDRLNNSFRSTRPVVEVEFDSTGGHLAATGQHLLSPLPAKRPAVAEW